MYCVGELAKRSNISRSNLVKCFVTKELMRWPGIEMIYGPLLRTTPVFSSDKRWEDLHTRVIEHVCIVALYYCWSI
jgi:26S proteasome regulatory subunit N5